MEPLSDGPDPFNGLLHAMAEDRVRDAAAFRSRTHWLLRQAEEEGTLRGVLADLAERAEPVVCVTFAGRRHAGVVQTLGLDFVALRSATGTTVLLALDAVAHIRTQPGTAAVTGDRSVRTDRRLAEVLSDIASDRPEVLVGSGLAEVRGELRAVGRDVLTLRLDGHRNGAANVALPAAYELRVG